MTLSIKYIQIGDKTHTQDQVINLHNFNTINTIARTDGTPKPEDLFFILPLIFRAFALDCFRKFIPKLNNFFVT